MANVNSIDIEHGNQSTIRLESDGAVIFIDPYNISGSQAKADIILITHEHYDHCDTASINKLSSEETVVIAPIVCKSKLARVNTISAGDKKTVNGIQIEAVPAYNTNKPYHPKGSGVGYVITINGKRIYHAGDTDRIPEMKKLNNIGIALLPVGGTYTMTAEEAADAVNEDIKPKVAIPMHYGSVVGSRADAEKFKKLCKCEVVIL